MTTILVDGLEISVLDIRAIGEKHELKCAAKNQLRFQLTSSQKKKEKESASVREPGDQSSMTSFITKEETVKAETRWVIESLLSNYSFNSYSTKAKLFAAMLLAVTLPSNYQWEKLDVSIAWRRNGSVLERYFLQSLKGVPLYVESFDKSYNNNLKQRQIDLHIRYWSNEKERVDVRLLNSSFVGKSAAVDYLNVVVLVSKVL